MERHNRGFEFAKFCADLVSHGTGKYHQVSRVAGVLQGTNERCDIGEVCSVQDCQDHVSIGHKQLFAPSQEAQYVCDFDCEFGVPTVVSGQSARTRSDQRRIMQASGKSQVFVARSLIFGMKQLDHLCATRGKYQVREARAVRSHDIPGHTNQFGLVGDRQMFRLDAGKSQRR